MADRHQKSGHDVRGGGPGSIGDLSIRLGCDVRDLLIEGFTLKQIYEVLDGKYTLDELRRRGPKGKRRR